jgi:hypothetical protein
MLTAQWPLWSRVFSCLLWVGSIISCVKPHDPAILSIHPEKEGLEQIVTHSLVKAGLFTMAQRWKQPKYLEWWMGKQNVTYTCNGKLFSHKKEWNSDTYYTVDETRRHAQWNEPKRTNIVQFHLYEILRIDKPIETENIIVVIRSWSGREIGSYCLIAT